MDWQPGTTAEQRMESARAASDLPAFLIALARTPILLLEPPPGQAAWATAHTQAGECLVAFTSGAAMAAAGSADHPCRSVSFTELATTWPDPAWKLALNPGVTLETLLEAQTVLDVAALAAQPATESEARLMRALDAGDIEAYVALLMSGDVVLPLPEGGTSIRDLDDERFPWFRMPPAEPGSAAPPVQPPVVVFTSIERWQQVARDQPCARAPFLDVVCAWPPDSGLTLDPGLAHGGLIDAAVMAHLRAEARERVLEAKNPS